MKKVGHRIGMDVFDNDGNNHNDGCRGMGTTSEQDVIASYVQYVNS